MGRGCAQVFASAGFDVALTGPRAATLEKAIEGIRDDLGFLAAHGPELPEGIDQTLSRITVTTDQEEALAGADFVLECAPEDMALKQELFSVLDRVASPETVLASNTSAMSITEIAAASRGRHRILGTHWWNPPHLMPLVEVVRTADVEDWAVVFTMELLKAAGKHPVECKKDVPGFVANRLQHALWREAISIVEHGIADAATVDECLCYGPGLRWPVPGALENSDLVGTDLTLAIHTYLLEHLEDSHEPSPLLLQMGERRQLGVKTGTGFYEWTPESAQEAHNRLMKYLLQNGIRDCMLDCDGQCST
jgi:3-hydroxybutyryl-CoA dehydrogenase